MLNILHLLLLLSFFVDVFFFFLRHDDDFVNSQNYFGKWSRRVNIIVSKRVCCLCCCCCRSFTFSNRCAAQYNINLLPILEWCMCNVECTHTHTHMEYCGFYRRKFGAENSTKSVAIIVNNVKMMRQIRSTTIAANFQSRAISLSASSCLSYIYIYRNRIKENPKSNITNPQRRYTKNVAHSWIAFTWSVI